MQETKARQYQCCFGDHGLGIVCRSILGTIVRILTHSPRYMVEDLRFESAGGVELPVKMPGYFTPRHSTHFWIGWQQETQVEKPIASDGVSVMQDCRKP